MAPTPKEKDDRGRHLHDAYDTPTWAIRRFLETGFIKPGMSLLEPCAGDGSIIHTTNEWFAQRGEEPVDWAAYEIRSKCKKELKRQDHVSQLTIGSFLSRCDEIGFREFDVAFTNPPFAHALDFVKACWSRSKYVVFLLRVNFIATERRYEWMHRHVPDVYLLPNRPSFRVEGGTDSQEYAWLVWDTSIDGRRRGAFQVLKTTALAERKLG